MTLHTKTAIKLLATCLLASLACSSTVLANQETSTEATGNMITWNDLTPDIDTRIYKQYQEGNLPPGEFRGYVQTFRNTPNKKLDDKKVSIVGYLLPQNLHDDGSSTRFALVRQIGTWSHTENTLYPNQLLVVEFEDGLKLNQSTQVRYQVSGTLSVGNYEVPVSRSFYHIKAATIAPNQKRYNERY